VDWTLIACNVTESARSPHFFCDDFLGKFCIRQGFAGLLSVGHHPFQKILHDIALGASVNFAGISSQVKLAMG